MNEDAELLKRERGAQPMIAATQACVTDQTNRLVLYGMPRHIKPGTGNCVSICGKRM